MSGLSKKQISGNGPNQRPAASPISRGSPSKSASSMNGIGRSPSLRGSPGLSRPSRGNAYGRSPQSSFSNSNSAAPQETNEEDAKAEHVSLLEELKSRVQRAETASEEYQRQLNLLQARLDESQHEHGQLEERLHESHTRIENLERDQTAAARDKRESEEFFKIERNTLLQDKAEKDAKITELQTVNQRLKESLALRETRGSVDGGRLPSRTNSGHDLGQFAPPSTLQRSNSKENSKIVIQKDRVIESLRLELAEAQIKIMELDSNGGGPLRELEKKLMEVKIANARLTEDNESFQLLLSEKTLNGDFSKTETMQQSSGLGSLAEELGSEELEPTEGKTEDSPPSETEVKSLKDQNKALALYIETILNRLLQHKEFENILDKTPDLISGAPRPQTEKELPPLPPPKDEEQPTGFLQRARSVVKRPRPLSQLLAPTQPPAPPVEDIPKSPSIPIGRSPSVRSDGHKRAQSEMPTMASLTNQLHRSPPSTGSGGPLTNPGISPGIATATRTSFTLLPTSSAAAPTPSPHPTSRAPSSSQLSREGNPGSSSNSTFSDRSGGLDSPPRSSAGTNNYTGAVMTQNRLRPLRLVQENPAKEEDAAALAAKKKANRGSWMPAWMNQRTASNENA